MQDQPIVEGLFDPIIVEHIRNKRFSSIPSFRHAIHRLEEVMLRCAQCSNGRQAISEHLLKPITNALKAIRRPTRIPNDTTTPFHRTIPDNGMTLESEESEESGSEDGDAPEASHTHALVKPQPIPRSHKACVSAIKLGYKPSKVLVRRFNISHDDYDTGPTVEESLETQRELLSCFENRIENYKWISMMLRFRDHGYRMMPGSLHQFYLTNPTIPYQVAHVFPTPHPAAVEAWKLKVTTNPTLEELLRLDGPGMLPHSCITGSDMVEWGLHDMLTRAGTEQTTSSMSAFVTGRTEDGNYIRLNVKQDRVQPDDITISVDIDSVIWLTERLRFNAAFNLHTSPYRKESAPISTSNHTYVELLLPRLDEDVIKGSISGESKHVPLSTLPNTHFATFGRVEGAAVVTVVFPRMKHRYPLRNYSETKLPQEVELLWLCDVVYEALHRLGEKGIEPYVGVSYEDTKWKHAGAQETTQILAPEHMESLQREMDAILLDHGGDPNYDCFRSYFFVLEIRGIKVPTSSDDVEAKDPWESLVRNYPAFDWEYMEDTENGELLIDIGIGFHPSEETDVVGFWDMDVLRLGFDYGGYNQGTSHSVSTVTCIGGIQAEMSRPRRLRTHIAYRQAYNLSYEVIRGKLTREQTGFFSAGSAYHQTDAYRRNVEGVINAFMRNASTSYGVRDEYRCRGTARRLIMLLVAKVSFIQQVKIMTNMCAQAWRYLLELNPIVWLPSSLWFNFLRRRLLEISNVQRRLYQLARRPLNYGIITSLLSNMAQHVGITPVVKDPDITRALSDVHFEGVSRRFGCFFLHNLDLETGELPEVRKVDPPGLLITLRGQAVLADSAAQEGGSSEAPSALAQTWKQICNSLNPTVNRYIPINPFTWDVAWLVHSVAEALFCNFTRQFWAVLTDSAFHPLEHTPATLKEAMELWSLDSVKVRIQHQVNYHLIPSGDSLSGAVPEKNRSYLFATLRNRFFPGPGTGSNPTSAWALLYRKGYVTQYHKAIKSSGDNGSSLNAALDGIFMNLQILPYNPGQPNSTQPLWRCDHGVVTLLFNSAYLQLLDRNVKRPEGESRGQRSKKLLSVVQLDRLLRGNGQGIPQGKKEKKSRAHRIGKSKNWRQPPQRNVRGRAVESSGAGDEAVEEGTGGGEVEMGEEEVGDEVHQNYSDEGIPETHTSGEESSED